MNLNYPLFKNPFIAICFFALTVILINSCSKGGSNPAPQNTTPKLAITSLSVSSGPYTTAVILTGTGFSSTLANNQVFFNGASATPIYVNSGGTNLFVSVPLAAGTGNVTIKVNGVTATGSVFTYQQAEVVTLLAGNTGIGSANGSGSSASFSNPTGIITDAAGNIYVADQENDLIRKITPAGLVSTLAGSGKAGKADGQGTSASFTRPFGLAIDGAGNIYVTDELINAIRKITPGGLVSTLPVSGSFGNFTGVAVDASGNIFIIDQGIGKIYKITPANVLTTVYSDNSLNSNGLTLDKSGNIYVTSGNEIMKITQAGVASVFAGNGNILGGDLDGTGTAASFSGLNAITIDNTGNLFVTDQNYSSIREITPAQVVTTFKGLGGGNYLGPLAQAELGGLVAITINASGNFYVIDGNAIKEISFQ